MAFASSTFLGTTSLKGARRRASVAPASCASTVRAVAASSSGRSRIWDNYLSSARPKWGPAPPATPEPPASPSKRSKIWEAYLEANRIVQGKPGMPEGTFTPAESALRAASTPFFREFAVSSMRGFAMGGDARSVLQRPWVRAVDDYIAECARRQYIQATNTSGVYALNCTEGSARFLAEDARIAALAARYRARQIPSALSFADLYENRRRANVLARGCNYEESLSRRYAAAAQAVVTGNSEKSSACARYAYPQSKAEKYMVECVERAASARATAGGVYGVMCCDGTVKGAAEAKRVTGLAVRFRNGQRSALAKEAAKFEVARYARENFGKMCSYEENLFNNYPATAAAMRPDAARY